MPINEPIDQQNSQLDTSMNTIKTEIHLMRKCLEANHKFMDSLKHASNFLNELRTSNLNPKQYYELYIVVYDGLEHLSNFLESNHSNNHLIDLYELVQYAGNIVPRLYLMITIGSLYMKVEGSPVLEILSDMLEMCKGVQHPIRGLFLRYYLNQRTKELLPLKTQNERNQSIQFVVSNFIEMNKLWVRLQFQGPLAERSKRCEERKELKVLVGSNLVRLSQMDFIDKVYYKNEILPLLLEQIIRCHDSIAQVYLLDVIVQIFPDDFQLTTSKEFLSCLLSLNPDVNISSIVISLVNRLIDYKDTEELKDSEESIEDNRSFFNDFLQFVKTLNELKPDLNDDIYLTIVEKVMRLSVEYSPNDFDNLNDLFNLAIEKFNVNGNKCDSNKYKLILLTPVEHFSSIKSLFNLNDNYFKLFHLQPIKTKNDIMLKIIKSFIWNNTKINTLSELHFISKFLSDSILLKETKQSETKSDLFGSSAKTDLENASSPMTIEFEYLNKLIHLIHCKNSLEKYALLESILPILRSSENLHLVLPTYISCILKLIRKVNFESISEDVKDANKKEIIKMFNKVSELINDMKNIIPLKALNLNLVSAEIANECTMVNICYEFFIESFIIYEELLVESKIQYQALCTIMNKLILVDQLITLNIEDFDKLVTKAAIYGSRLLKKTDQCRAVYNASHLWWIIKESDEESYNSGNEEPVVSHITLKKDEKRVLECLQKSLRTADSIMDSNVKLELFVEILNQSIYFFIHGNEMINVRYLNGLIELIGNSFKELGITADSNKDNGLIDGTWRHFNRTLKYIKEQRAIDPRFLDLVLN